jgi:hypothetical protein
MCCKIKFSASGKAMDSVVRTCTLSHDIIWMVHQNGTQFMVIGFTLICPTTFIGVQKKFSYISKKWNCPRHLIKKERYKQSVSYIINPFETMWILSKALLDVKDNKEIMWGDNFKWFTLWKDLHITYKKRKCSLCEKWKWYSVILNMPHFR